MLTDHAPPQRGRRAQSGGCLTGVVKKDKPRGIVSARVLFDGTNGISVNSRTRIGDPDRAPIATDLKRVVREEARQGERTLALTAGVAEAHRQIPIEPRDWHPLGCQAQAGGDVYVNAVGTFGVVFASCYWSRVASALGRLSQWLTGKSATTWHSARSGRLPLGIRRSALSHSADRVFRPLRIGIPSRRVERFIRWAQDIASAHAVKLTSFEEGFSRIMCVTWALEHERPFPGPPCRCMSSHPRGSVRVVHHT